MSEFSVRLMEPSDIPAVVALQRLCFPSPFPFELLWDPSHLERHLQLYPSAQFVVELEGVILASASNTRISEERCRAHGTWDATVGGPYLETFDSTGSTLYGLDISVHPEYRRRGIASALYRARLEFAFKEGMRYVTACRIPSFADYEGSLEAFIGEVVSGRLTDPTLTPLLKLGLTAIGGQENFMEDKESRNCAVLLEWMP
ncbi:MAG: GNAT family N-acetyltransferase [Fimbriimonadaceae bacterium]